MTSVTNPAALVARDALDSKRAMREALNGLEPILQELRGLAPAADFCTCGGTPRLVEALSTSITALASQLDHRRIQAEAVAMGSRSPLPSCDEANAGKVCLACGEARPLSEYSGKGLGYIDPICKPCRAESRRRGTPLSAPLLRAAQSSPVARRQ